jgi:hypothetical protein
VRVIHWPVAALPIVTTAVAAGAAAGSAVVVVIALAAGGGAVVAIRLGQATLGGRGGGASPGRTGVRAGAVQYTVPQPGDEVTVAARFARGAGYVRHGSVLYWAAGDSPALGRGAMCRVDTAVPGANGIPVLSVTSSGR